MTSEESLRLAERLVRPYLTTGAFFGVTPDHHFRNRDMDAWHLVVDLARMLDQCRGQPDARPPVDPDDGQRWFDTDTNTLRVWHEKMQRWVPEAENPASPPGFPLSGGPDKPVNDDQVGVDNGPPWNPQESAVSLLPLVVVKRK